MDWILLAALNDIIYDVTSYFLRFPFYLKRNITKCICIINKLHNNYMILKSWRLVLQEKKKKTKKPL